MGALDLRGAKGEELRTLLVQPKRLALFAYLLLARPQRLHRRDSLLALFWPESSTAQARRALRQALHFLRAALGQGVLVTRGDEEVGVALDQVRCDVLEFDRAFDGGQRAEALAVYRGHLLEGFHVSGVAAELDQWLDDERTRLRARAVDAASSLAEEAERQANTTLAVQRYREMLRLDPSSEQALRRLVRLLESLGDRTGALRACDEFARRLAVELDALPSVEIRAMAQALRTMPVESTVHRWEVTGDVATPPTEDFGAKGNAPGHADGRRLRLHGGPSTRLLVAALVLLASMTAAVAIVDRVRVRPPDHPTVLAVGALEFHGGSDSLASVRVLRDLLATDLARVPETAVVSHSRIQELLARTSGGVETRLTLARAARQAGATEILEGELQLMRGGSLRLDLRRVDVATGMIRRAYSIEGSDLPSLVEQSSAEIADDLGRRTQGQSLSELTTTTFVARRFYEEGVRRFYQGDSEGALHLLRASLAEDSTFAVAAYYAARAAAIAAPDTFATLAAHALRMSRRATERERLMIAALWAALANSPDQLAVAESLAMRFPHDPEAILAHGRALFWAGDHARAVQVLRRFTEQDATNLVDVGDARSSSSAPCTECDALHHLITSYHALDSLPAAVRTARTWLRMRPQSEVAWRVLAVTLGAQGRVDEARSAWRERQALFGWQPLDDAIDRANLMTRAGEFAEVDRLLADRMRNGAPLVQQEAIWWLVISRRNQGRLEEALAGARRLRAAWGETSNLGVLAEAQVLFEQGEHRRAARLFEESRYVSRHTTPPELAGLVPGRHARGVVWSLAHAATAYAAAGDTARLRAVVDSLALLGPNSAYGRDRRLHHHARGLLLQARGDRDSAEREFRRAIFSPTMGYTRTNYELARLLLAQGRAAEAASVLSAALRGDVQGSGYYVTHTQLHEALAQAYDAAGQRDSARVYWARVANAWRAADPPLRERAARARERAMR